MRIREMTVSGVALALAHTASAEDRRQTLIDSANNVRVEEWRAAGDFWSVRKTVLRGGKQEGVDFIEVDNGALRLSVIPTRGMSVFEVRSGDLRLGWDSPVKEIVHPRHIDLGARGGLGWLEGFNEWMVRCGLESAGHPGQDKFVNNVGDEATMDLTLHGKIGNIPASYVEVIVEDDPEGRIRVRGRVDERMFYGPQLELWTEISTVPGSRAFQIQDKLTNRGGAEQEFQIIYHANFGAPLLEKGAKLVVPVQSVTPFNDHAAKSVDSYDVYPAPTPGFIEQVYCLRPVSDASGRTLAVLHNADADQGVTMRYSVKELPYLTQWKNALPKQGGYVTGVEPGTGFPYNRRVERRYGRVPKLKPGESRSFTLDVELLTDERAVDAATSQARRLAGGRKPDIRENPEVDLSQFD